MRSFIRLLGLILLLPTTTMAAPLDYAYQARLDKADFALLRVPLELEVILNLTRADLGDIAVFNAAGKQLLHSITPAQGSTLNQNRELAVHEFSRFQSQQSRTVTTREQTRQPNSLSEQVTTETIALQKRHKDYLVEFDDEAAKTATLERIELYWTQEPVDQILKVRVEAGNTLDELRVIQPGKSLANRDSSDPGWRSIEDIPAGVRYLRLTALNDVTRFDLQRVVAHYSETRPAPVLSHRLTTEPEHDGDAVFYRIDYPSAVSAQSLRIIPATPNSLISGQLYGQWGDSEERRVIRDNVRQHNMVGEDIRASKPIRLPQRQYRAVAISSDSELTAAPAIELIYPQYELLFIGDGSGPYTIAWGNRDSTAASSELASLLADSLAEAQRKAVPAALGKIERAGGEARLRQSVELPWKKWLLWTLLVLAVIVTARMAFRLYREMDATSST